MGPTRAQTELLPRPTLRTTVGNISELEQANFKIQLLILKLVF